MGQISAQTITNTFSIGFQRLNIYGKGFYLL